MGPMPAEVERLKTLNSCLPGLKFPQDAVEIADWSVEPPEETTAFKPGAAFFEKEYEYYLISRGFFYDKKFEIYVMYNRQISTPRHPPEGLKIKYNNCNCRI